MVPLHNLDHPDLFHKLHLLDVHPSSIHDKSDLRSEKNNDLLTLVKNSCIKKKT